MSYVTKVPVLQDVDDTILDFFLKSVTMELSEALKAKEEFCEMLMSHSKVIPCQTKVIFRPMDIF